MSSEARAITFKVFIAQFINTGLLILLVFGRLPNDQELPVLQDLGVMDGEIDSFNKDWYLQVSTGRGCAAYRCCGRRRAPPHPLPPPRSVPTSC